MSRPMLGVCVLMLVAFSVSTYTRAQVWHDEYTLWSDAVAKAPTKPRPWINLALALEQRGDLDSALKAHQLALMLSFQPRLTFYQQKFSKVASETNIARIFAVRGQDEEALNMLNMILREHPNFPWARYNRGVLYARMGRCLDGLPDFEIAQILDPGFVNPGCPPPQ